MGWCSLRCPTWHSRAWAPFLSSASSTAKQHPTPEDLSDHIPVGCKANSASWRPREDLPLPQCRPKGACLAGAGHQASFPSSVLLILVSCLPRCQKNRQCPVPSLEPAWGPLPPSLAASLTRAKLRQGGYGIRILNAAALKHGLNPIIPGNKRSRLG